MRTIPLGKTGEQVSALCLGAMYFGTRNDRETSERLLDAYVDKGGTFIDTANIYAWWVEGFKGGESEALIGEWMRQRGNRDRLFIATKVGFGYGDVPKRLTPKVIEQECEKSLKALGVETIDLYYAHVDDRESPLEETMQAFDRLVRAGKVRYIAASNYLAWRLEEARYISHNAQLAEFCAVQQHYTYLKLRPGTTVNPQEFANDDLLDYCRNREITLLAYSVLQNGSYTRADRPFRDIFKMPDNDRRLANLQEVAAETGATVNQVVIAWMLASNPVVLPLIAASTEEQLEENFGALEVRLSAEQMERLNRAGVK